MNVFAHHNSLSTINTFGITISAKMCSSPNYAQAGNSGILKLAIVTASIKNVRLLTRGVQLTANVNVIQILRVL